MAYRTIHSPVGELTLFDDDQGHVVALEWGRVPGGTSSPVLDSAAAELEDYFDGRRRDFGVALAATGTDFQRRVWTAMARIPYGTTCTYGELARVVGSAPRAVGGACGRNPLPIIVPCHRVVGGGGSLHGYSGGGGTETKRWLLDLEARFA